MGTKKGSISFRQKKKNSQGKNSPLRGLTEEETTICIDGHSVVRQITKTEKTAIPKSANPIFKLRNSAGFFLEIGFMPTNFPEDLFEKCDDPKVIAAFEVNQSVRENTLHEICVWLTTFMFAGFSAEKADDVIFQVAGAAKFNIHPDFAEWKKIAPNLEEWLKKVVRQSTEGSADRFCWRIIRHKDDSYTSEIVALRGDPGLKAIDAFGWRKGDTIALKFSPKDRDPIAGYYKNHKQLGNMVQLRNTKIYEFNTQ